MRKRAWAVLVSLLGSVLFLNGCARQTVQKVEIDPASLKGFAPLPAVIDSSENPVTPEKVALGRKLYFEKRLSKSQDISCDSCHPLDNYGAEDTAVSTGFKGQKGKRNAPTVFNAAGHFAQFWDGRAADVEEQAKGPMMNPVEMAMPSSNSVVAALNSVPEYRDDFRKAFPGDRNPVTLDNAAKAIGAFERTLITPSRWDKFLKGDQAALTNEEKAGFKKFSEVGCQTCHAGAYVGGAMYQKAGLIEPWPTKGDEGRFSVSKQDSDRMVFKVPSLRNVEKTAPYFHDGSVAKLDGAVRAMAEYQLGRTLKDAEVQEIVSWLKTLTGEPYVVQAPKDSKASPAAPKPDRG